MSQQSLVEKFMGFKASKIFGKRISHHHGSSFTAHSSLSR